MYAHGDFASASTIPLTNRLAGLIYWLLGLYFDFQTSDSLFLLRFIYTM